MFTSEQGIFMERIYVDTESISFVAPTMLIQYGTNSDNIILHEIFREKTIDTLNLIQRLMDATTIFYNASHDAFHLTKTFNILLNLDKNTFPEPEEYLNVERKLDTFQYILKPKGCVDLLLNVRKEFQYTMKTHPLRIKVPKKVAEEFKEILEEKFKTLPPIIFAKYEGKPYIRTIEIKEDGFSQVSPEEKSKLAEGKLDFKIHPDWVYLKIEFKPSAKLKDVMKYVFGKEVKQLDLNIKRPESLQYSPHTSDWLSHFYMHKSLWQYNEHQRSYAREDVLYLMELDKFFAYPNSNYESELSFAFGSQHCIGYDVDVKEVKKQLRNNLKSELKIRRSNNCSQVNINSATQVKKFLLKDLDDEYTILIPNTSKETFKNLIEMEDLPDVLSKKLKAIKDLRRICIEQRLLKRLNSSKKLYCVFKTMGTRTGREAGGDSLTNSGDKINPQGIPKGELRKLFTFGSKAQGGDFSQFEIAIFAACYNDPKINELLMSGKKIHGIWAEFLFGVPYNEVMKGQDEPNSLYNIAKKAFFAMLYGAQTAKIAYITSLPIEQVKAAFEKFYNEFTKVAEAQKALEAQFNIFKDYKFHNTLNYVETFLGFRRSFWLEIEIERILISLLNKEFKGNIRNKKGVLITTGQAVNSGIYSEIHQLESHMQRIAGNFKIQSPGAQMTKILQGRLNSLNSIGFIHKDFYCMTFNAHDELIVTGPRFEETKQVVEDFINEYKIKVPFLKMKWKQIKNWSEND